MTIETTITLDEDQHAFLVKQVEAGSYGSLNEAIAEAIETFRVAESPFSPAEIEELRRRAATPRDKLIPWNDGEAFDRIEKRIRSAAQSAE